MFKARITNYPVDFNKTSAANLKASYNLESVNTEEKMRDDEGVHFYKSIKEPPVKSGVSLTSKYNVQLIRRFKVHDVFFFLNRTLLANTRRPYNPDS